MEDYQGKKRGGRLEVFIPECPRGIPCCLQMPNLLEIIQFFCALKIPLLPCYGIQNGLCTCKKGTKCPSPGKHPLMPHWQMIASIDPARVLSWFGKNQSRPINLAISTGRFSPTTGKYLLGVDADKVDHPFMKRLAQDGRTVTQRTGSGGSHALYWSRLPVKNSCQIVEEKIDVRGSGGILIIAPSAHYSGRNYEMTCDLSSTQIQDIPEFLEKRVRISVAEKRKSTVALKQPTKPGEMPEITKTWQKMSIPDIRDKIAMGMEIPCGVRNVTLHRLLSSDRAKGVVGRNQLYELAKTYLLSFEDPESFQDDVESIVKSVFKYPAYNNSHERVNELYMAWLRKNGHSSTCELEDLERIDKEFFGTLKTSTEFGPTLSLKEITEARAQFFQARGLTKFAVYRTQLLAKKLSDLGFKKKRTSKSNSWAISLPNENSMQSASSVCKNMNMETLSMAEELKEETQKKGLKSGDIIDRNGQKFRVELIETKVPVKQHTREHLYLGNLGFDYNKALMALMGRMTEEMIDQLDSNTLVMDSEKTKFWMDTVQIGDVIGVKGFRYKVVGTRDLNPSPSLLVSKVNHVQGKPGEFKEVDSENPVEFLTAPVLDHARELNLLDILWRDGKPFGEPDTKDMTIVLLHDLDETQGAKKPKKDKKKKS